MGIPYNQSTPGIKSTGLASDFVAFCFNENMYKNRICRVHTQNIGL